VLLDVRRVAAFADYFVIASAENPRQMRALVDTLEKDLRDEGIRAGPHEGSPDSGWVLIDYGDVIVHLFSPDLRDYYALEELWSAATQVVRIQ
jgi:ribosome-associated protein